MLESFIKYNFEEAVQIQDKFDHDIKLVNSIRAQDLSINQVVKWMTDYSLFRSSDSIARSHIAQAFIDFTAWRLIQPIVDDHRRDFRELHNRLKAVRNQKWLSATSKLLWCVYPTELFIYDSYVERVILVLQCMNEEMAKLPRLGTPAKAVKDTDSSMMTNYYINYQSLVGILYKKYNFLLDQLKREHNSEYEYQVRIFDKLLWMMGKYTQSFNLNSVRCEYNRHQYINEENI